ncbi:hypothetical protein GpartN1_g849.t1 [Galdieria partita]|uniref:YdbS-like PH domain-containing protein n=1 Tax=Galdieria partita TaxID=83374 RepID=A0A9C7PQ49_9RHOD|nr:hypothetical protein GpartN1_g197.t1 [Galdieria partita]GJQ09058.1 hypothetical protein GpartN1_g849.t1 [Galdieria partita]
MIAFQTEPYFSCCRCCKYIFQSQCDYSFKRKSLKKRLSFVFPLKMKQTSAKKREEIIVYKGGPSWTELIVPTVSLLTVVGIFPFLATVARQLWVRYQLTSNRIVVDSGFRGKQHVQVNWDEVVSFRSVRRFGGISGDFVLQLKDGSKLEIRSIPNYDKVYEFLIEKNLKPFNKLS